MPGVVPADGAIEGRVIAATLVCIARHGIAKTTLEDVARETGCSRATLYRYFDGRSALVAAAVRAEVDRVTDVVRRAAIATDTLEDAIVAILYAAGCELHRHAALRFVADAEPDRLLPHLTFAGSDRFLAAASSAFAPCFEPYLGVRSERAAEWVARVGLTLWLHPSPVSLTDEAGVRAYVREFVLPAVDSSADLVPLR
jgi:AcrR family transcriptional regulator